MNPAQNTMYRLTAKAVIYNADGKVLLLRESNGEWGLPGGGVDHGEDIVAGLTRELQEELGVACIKSAELFNAYTFYARTWETWWLWLLYKVEVDLPSEYVGELAHGAEFVDVATFDGSGERAEERIYRALR